MYMKLIHSSLLLTAITCQTNQDYLRLRDTIQKYVMDNINQLAPLVRIAFHDLANYNPPTGGPHGCIASPPVSLFNQNSGLTSHLHQLLQYLDNTTTMVFPLGDVLSMAGKVAVEMAYPCIQIRWRYGRSPCKMGELPLAPVHITSSQQLDPFLNRYGLTRIEMAVLIAGTHGLKNAKSIHGVFGYGDGVAWIRDSMGLEWKLQSSAGVIWYNSWNGFDNLIRLPSDMMFFPRVLRTRPIDYPFLDIELGLKELGKNPPSFYADFERVFAKMLEIGVANDSMVELIEEKRVGICLNGIVQVMEDNTTLTENEQPVVSTTSPIPNSSQTNFSLIFYLCLFYLI